MGAPRCIWDGEALVSRQRCRWSEHYEQHGRDPNNMELADYVTKYAGYTRDAAFRK